MSLYDALLLGGVWFLIGWVVASTIFGGRAR